jgi:hypothetical protein
MRKERLFAFGATAINMTQAKTHSTGRGLTSLAKIYSKAIRDRIPEIIMANREECIVRRLTDAEFLSELEKKLHEELADILEVVYKISELRGFLEKG